MTQAENDDCNAALLRIFPKIEREKIHAFLDGTDELSNLQKAFYKTYLDARYDKILVPAHEQVMAQKQDAEPIFKQ